MVKLTNIREKITVTVSLFPRLVSIKLAGHYSVVNKKTRSMIPMLHQDIDGENTSNFDYIGILSKLLMKESFAKRIEIFCLLRYSKSLSTYLSRRTIS